MQSVAAFFASIILVGSLSAPLFASALTQQEKTTLILQLVQKVLELQQQIVALGGAPIAIPPGLAASAQESDGSAGAAGCTIERTLALGSRGEDVRCLQTYLISQNLLAPDSATGYFGPLTRAAVIALQRQHNLEQVGHVGRLTRGIVNAGAAQPSTTAIQTPPSSSFGAENTGAIGGGSSGGGVAIGGGGSSGVDSNSPATSTVTPEEPPQPESISLLPVISFSANPASIAPGQRTTLSWVSTNATWCSAGGGWSGTKATSGTQGTGIIWSTTTFTLTCFGPGGLTPVTKSITVTDFPGVDETGASDTTPPAVSLTAPLSGASVSGVVAITATASDNVAVAAVEFKDDNTTLGTDTAAPYSSAWNTASTTNGTHTLTAVARDAAGNRATSTITVLVANPSGFHCYFTNGIRVCHNAANEATYLSVPNANVAYNIHTIRDGNTYYTIYHSEHRGAVPPEGGDSIQSGFTTGTYTGLMPVHDFRIWGGDITDSTLAWYSIDAAGNRVSGPGGGGNPIAISGLPGDPYFYVFFLGVADDDRDRIRGESDWRHYLIQARTQNFITYDLKTDSGWEPFSTATADTIRPAMLTDAAGAALRGNAPKALGATQGLIGSMSYVNGTYHFFYGDYTPDGLSYNIYHRTTDNLATGMWSVPKVLFARGTDTKNRTMVRIAKAEGMDRWLVLYGCYVTTLDGTQRQDMCLQYTQNLTVIGAGGLSSLSLTPDFALGFSDLASRSFAQPNLVTDRWGNQTHVNNAVNTGEFYWSDYHPNQCSADPRPGCPVYGGDVLRGGWNVKVM